MTIESQYYTGKEIRPDKSDLVVKVNGTTLASSDYEIIGYENNIKRGKASVIIRGKGYYGGTKTVPFMIVAKSLNCKIIYYKNATDATGVMKNSTIAPNARLAANAYRRNGYTFEGWSMSPDGPIVFTDKAQFVLENENSYGRTIYLYAQWKAK